MFLIPVLQQTIMNKGIIVKAVSGFYYVAALDTVFECKARGNFRYSKISPIVGDRVEFTKLSENRGVVESVLPRKNCLDRPLVANIDKLIIVSSYTNPAPDLYMIDRLTAIAAFNDIKPVIVFNKSDTGDFTEYARIYRNAGFNTYVVSALNPDSLTDLKGEYKNSVCAMAGNSGVGKSSLLNMLFNELTLKTGEVSTALGRGKHTTRHTQLFSHSLGGFVADTPGFSSIDQVKNQYEFKKNLDTCFTDFRPYIHSCRFTNCTHTCEKGCGLLEALSSGKIEKSRHESYVALVNVLKDINSWK